MAPPVVMQPMIEIRGLAKRYGAVEVLRGIDLAVRRGEILGIIGPSGSGKSTLLRCINLLEEFEAGEITLAGEPVRVHVSEQSQSRLRAKVGMVFQNFNLFPHMTVLGNIIEGPTQVLRLPKAQAVDEAEILLRKVGLLDKSSAYPSTLSGGQQQRAAIARALAMKPLVMLFDEPTSSLDPELVGEVLDVMQALIEDGMTMVIATHEMAFIREIAHSVAFIDDGRVVEIGPPETIFGHPSRRRTIEFLRRVRVLPRPGGTNATGGTNPAGRTNAG